MESLLKTLFITYLVNIILRHILEICVKQCCIRQELPLKCLKEQLESRRDSDHNETHQVSSMILSGDCQEYQTILDNCKSECMEEEKGKLMINRDITFCKTFHFYG